MARPKIDEMRKFAKKEYKRASKGSGSKALEHDPEMEYDKDGYMILRHISELPPASPKTDLVTDLTALEQRLDMYREKNEVKHNVTAETSKPAISSTSDNKKSKKMDKKARKKLLKSIFNNADKVAEEAAAENDDEEEKPTKADTLDTTYGLRYTPMVNMIHGIIGEYDELAESIKEDLANRPNMKTMYRSSQIANLISVKNSKLSAIKELTSIAKQITDLEYKKEKDSRAGEADDDKAILALTTRFLRGSLDNDDVYVSDEKPKKKDKKNKNKKGFVKMSSSDDDDDDEKPIKKKDVRGYVSTAKIEKMAEDLQDDDDADDGELADALGKALMKHKSELEFTPYEKHINLEGKYSLAILADAEKPSSSWKFIAIDKEGKEIKGFKDKYPELVPKKSDCKMSFNVTKMRVVDKNTSITYKLYLK